MKLLFWLNSNDAACWNISAHQLERTRRELPDWLVETAADEASFLQALGEAEVAAAWTFRQPWFEMAPRLKMLKTPAAGLDYFAADPPPGIIFSGSSFHGPLMAETALAWILAHTRGLFRAEAAMKQTAWPRRFLADRMSSLYGSTLTILGFGSIGKAIGRAASLFGCRIIGIQRHRIREDDYPSWFRREKGGDLLFSTRETPADSLLAGLLPESNHLLLALPSGRESDGIIGRKELELLPWGGGIYNLGRGNAIDETALHQFLTENPDTEAYLDVFREEPLPEESPLRTLSNAHLMPHISATSSFYLDRFLDELIPECRALSDS
jgi:D-2-hydroxyacid dehydrogenase (NADP+)